MFLGPVLNLWEKNTYLICRCGTSMRRNALSLVTNILEACPRCSPLYERKMMVNHRLSRVRQVVGNACGILFVKLRIFEKPIPLSVEITLGERKEMRKRRVLYMTGCEPHVLPSVHILNGAWFAVRIGLRSTSSRRERPTSRMPTFKTFF